MDNSIDVNQTMAQAQADFDEFRRNAEEAFGVEETARRKVAECEKQIRAYTRAAEQALKAGQESDALKLLETKKQLEAELAGRQKDYSTAHENAEELRPIYKEWSSKMDTLERHTSMARAAQIASRIYGNTESISLHPAGMPDLSGTGNEDLLAKYSRPESGSAQADLDALKKKLGKQPT